MTFMKNIKEQLVTSKIFKNLLLLLPDPIIQLHKKPRILIEPTNICNLKCPLCPTAHAMKRKKGVMKFRDFKTIIDEIKDIKSHITMNFAGEPTINKDLFRMIRYASESGMTTMISTNGTLLHNFNFRDIIESGLTQMVISLDGASQETQEKYRVGSNFNQILKNIKLLVKTKEELNSEFPIIDWQFIVMQHNQHEIDKVKELAAKIGVNRLILKAVNISMGYDFSCINTETLQKKTGILMANKFKRYRSIKPIQICPWIWESVILWNGDVTVCCFDFNGEAVVGNVFTDGGFKAVWKSKKYKETRKKILKKELKICRTCNRLEEVTLKKVLVFKKCPDVIPKAYFQ